MEFVLVRSYTINDFNDEINTKLKRGWKPFGVVFVYNGYYHLVMIKGESC